MEDCKQQVNQAESLLDILMKISLDSSEQAFELAKHLDKLDTQEFINWQDKLNRISIDYK